MERHQRLGFKTATDLERYEADYNKRAKQHQEEQLNYVNNNQNAKLFENVQHGVLIVGFKHYHQKDGAIEPSSRHIKNGGMAGLCGQLYTTDLEKWCREPRVKMIVKAFQEIEVSRHSI
jgi:hypothetical protein